MNSVITLMCWEIVATAGTTPQGGWRLGQSWALSLGKDYQVLIDDFQLFTIIGEIQKK